MKFDIIVENGFIIDGTGNPFFKADVGVADGKMVEIGALSSHSAEVRIDAEGLIVAPGFIDIHTHSDFTLLVNPRAESSVRQGVTTAVIGNCGHSCAPVSEETKGLLKKIIIGYSPTVEIDWHTLGEYLNRLEEGGIAQNVAPLVGHGAVRIAAMGFEDRAPKRDELERMKLLVAEAMEDGAFGLSSGLGYPPGSYATTEEMIELCRVVANYGGFYATHVRTYGEPGRLEAVKEAIRIGVEAGVPVQISHHTASAKAEETLPLIDEARAQGLDVTCDLHPYLWAATTVTVLLPKKTLKEGVDALLERLREPEERRRILEEIDLESLHPYLDSWDKVVLERSDGNPELVGKSFTEIAETLGMSPKEVVAYLLLNSKDPYNVYVLLHHYTEEDVIKVLRHPTSMVETDGMALAPYGQLASIRFHPRSYGSFPRVLRRFVREKRVITLEEAVRKMTSLPAQRLGLRDRGLLREGMWADMVIFDAERVTDRATYEEPTLYPEGIEYVIVNGTVVVEGGNHTGALPGMVLRRGARRV